MTSRRVLVVDDESGIRFALRNYLEGCGYEVREVEDVAACRMTFRDWRPDAIILDYKLPDGTALDLVEPIKAFDPSITIIVLTAHGSIELAVQSMKDGADHFMTKPIELSILAAVLANSLALQRSRRRDLVAKSPRTEVTRDPFIGKSKAIARLREDALRVLDSDLPVLIEGETGSGKGVVAEWIHQAGSRGDAAFVDLNCAGLSKEFLESELFGHEKGAFTGAVAAKQGLLELAHAGSVFFDEIGDMDILVQARILKVVESKKFRRLGDVRDRSVDIRLIAASHLNLIGLIAENRFRSDLYFRISTLPLIVPPLRERVEDIPEIAEHLLKTSGRDGRHLSTLSGEAIRALQTYHWPGNIRELRNVLERALLLSGKGAMIEARHLQFTTALATGTRGGGSGMTLEEMERSHIGDVLNEVNGKVDLAAKRLGIPRSSLYQKIKKYGLSTHGA